MRRLALTITLVLGLSAPASADAAIKSIWGPGAFSNGQSAFPTYKRLGAKDLQLVVNWASVAPTRPANPQDPNDPVYQWGTNDQTVADARRNGISVTVMLIRAPAWANGGKDETYAPENPNDFADFATAATKRYRGVKRWMIWGEPNRAVQFNPQVRNRPTAPRIYARILDASYKALKRVSKRNVVIGGMTFTAGDVLPGDWIRWMRLPNGKPPRLDMYGHNPFSTRFPDLKGKPIFGKNRDFSDLDTLRDEVWKVYKKKPKLWLSEFTIQSTHPSTEFNFFVSEREQARWLAAAYRIAAKNKWIAGLGWITLLDAPPDGSNTEGKLGLLTADLKEKPSFSAYRKAR